MTFTAVDGNGTTQEQENGRAGHQSNHPYQGFLAPFADETVAWSGPKGPSLASTNKSLA
jgi:hypothetical protein